MTIAPLITLPLLGTPLIYLTGRKLPRHILNPRLVSLIVLVLTGVWFVGAAREVALHGAQTATWGAVVLRLDGLSLLVGFMALLFSALVVFYSGPEMRAEAGEEKYYTVLVIITAAMIGLVCAGDLFNLWVWFELMAISSYLLVAFYRERAPVLAACIKYLIQTATGSALVLFSIALVLAQTGTLTIDRIRLTDSPLAVVTGTLFVIGFGVKIAIVPTYTWLPDAYTQAPNGVSALLSGVVTITGLAALLRALAGFVDLSTSWGALLIGIGLLNIVVGNMLALAQVHVKRMLAYSSISHMGYILLAIGVGLHVGQIASIQSGLLHLLNHGLMKVLAFMAVGAVIYLLGAHNNLTLDDLSGIAWRYPILGVALVIAALSLAGVPPLAGFMSKWQIFMAGLATGDVAIMLAVLFAALNSVFSLAYYLPLINALYRRQQRPTDLRLPMAMWVPIVGLTLALIVLGIWPGLVAGLIEPASAALMQMYGG